MKTSHLVVTSLIALTLLVSACAPAATPVPATAAPATSMPAGMPMGTPTGPATLNVSTNAKYGSILTDSMGMTLYIFLNDTSTTSTCSGACTNNWPAVLTNGSPVAGNGVDATKLGTTTRPDGTTQVTYNGHPLYYFAKDTKPGDANGQGIKNIWYVVSPAGDKITTP